MKLLTSVISIVGVACCAALLAYSANRASPTNLNAALLTDPDFITHLAKFSKSYASMDEYSLRAGIFRENLEKIRQLNLEHEDTVTFDVNHMADWTAEEYKSLLGFRKSPLSSYPSLQADGGSDMPETAYNTSDTADDMPDTFTPDTHAFDWRNKGVISPLFSLSQSNCWGMDWAIVAVAAMEASYKIS
jgi:hypothetical protein